MEKRIEKGTSGRHGKRDRERQSGKDGMREGKREREREKERQDKRQGKREKGTRVLTTGEGNNMVAEVKPERRMKQSEPAMNAKEEGSTIWRDTERNDKEDEGDPSKRKGDEKEEEEEVQEEMKEVGDSVHTGEKNLMPSMLKRGWGRIPLLLSMGNAREYERNKMPQQRHRETQTWGKKAPHKEENSDGKFGKGSARYAERRERTREARQTNEINQ